MQAVATLPTGTQSRPKKILRIINLKIMVIMPTGFRYLEQCLFCRTTPLCGYFSLSTLVHLSSRRDLQMHFNLSVELVHDVEDPVLVGSEVLVQIPFLLAVGISCT